MGSPDTLPGSFHQLRPVSIISVSFDTYFFTRLLVEKVREFVGHREYEIIVVDRGSTDGSREWLTEQPDVHLLTDRQWRRSRHTHGEAAEKGGHAARFDYVVLLDSDAHPMEDIWLKATVDRLDSHYRLAGGEYAGHHKGNPYGSYIHPSFMAFHKKDLGHLVVLRKMRGHDTDTGEEATIRLRDAGFGILGYPIEHCARFSVGYPFLPQISAGVFHAGRATRLAKNSESVLRETDGTFTRDGYIEPLQVLLRQAYHLDY
mgnify:FL=1